MPTPRRRCFFALPPMLLALAASGCGGGQHGGGVETLTREAKLNGMTCTLNLKEAKDPELTWAVTDRVIALFSGHRVEVEKNQVTLDGKTKPLPPRTEGVTIDFENNEVTIRAGGQPLFGPQVR